jgi:hypothetical protein
VRDVEGDRRKREWGLKELSESGGEMVRREREREREGEREGESEQGREIGGEMSASE